LARVLRAQARARAKRKQRDDGLRINEQVQMEAKIELKAETKEQK